MTWSFPLVANDTPRIELALHMHVCMSVLLSQAKDGTWKPYKDKVYSLNGRKKEFTLTALNVNIKPYV